MSSAPRDARWMSDCEMRAGQSTFSQKWWPSPAGTWGVLGRTLRGTTPTTSAELAALILEHAEVAVVPGEAFGPSGFLRLSYALGDDDLAEGVGRLQRLLAEAS